MSDLAPRLILASSSPQRQELLRAAGYSFDVEPAEIDEAALSAGLMPSEMAMRLALAKVQAVAARHADEAVVALGADTVVAFGDRPLGKPQDEADARAMLQLLGGTTHIVITAVAVMRPGGKPPLEGRALSAVRMRWLAPAEIDAYVATGQWRDKAGGYGIQDRDPFVMRMAGSKTNVVGLPIRLAQRMLAQAGIVPGPADRRPSDSGGGDDVAPNEADFR